ncbi:NADPH-dependent 7-cyano-7-deazaguanine reductase QueF [Cellvibrio sp. PSBB023]|uniref:NADPH-dependent 7-cyano-7-deazaguanine reductase QueF n=1 Tax=Cellvibrio sp. PSBB023 TaxID=1945512 RepID=UPI00098FD118|nr:NADPH-dependent 7-cyano-7-deazaguanine reductase QueF [Cellvibrio sp. PSBB023]AQT59032.1 NADPH-dependent 7-cyano-7-deazaguanine reductase QueF [Cellvibrio sp. PSBB023]
MGFNPLGQQTEYVSVYSPQLLFPIARAESRKLLNTVASLPFSGVDIWTGYELSWLDPKGKPVVAVAEFFIPCDSEFMIESKSFKLYLNSLNQSHYHSAAEVEELLARDLSAVARAMVRVQLYPLSSTQSSQWRAQPAHLLNTVTLDGVLLDDLSVSIDNYHPDPNLLTTADAIVSETLVSHLLKTNCPVTGQPDWASLVVRYTGKKIEHDSLLRYIVSFREHQDFHEHCVERIFSDIAAICKPTHLTVYARYTRRGGLDINPFRSSHAAEQPELLRLIRQ